MNQPPPVYIVYTKQDGPYAVFSNRPAAEAYLEYLGRPDGKILETILHETFKEIFIQ